MFYKVDSTTRILYIVYLFIPTDTYISDILSTYPLGRKCQLLSVETMSYIFNIFYFEYNIISFC